MSKAPRESALDGPAARVVAVAIALAGVAFLGWLHRDDLFPPQPGAAAASDPRQAAFNACYEPQAARIDEDAAAGEISAEQAKLFKGRAEALCADQADKGSSAGPRLPLQ